jgi:quercetin dioxygenase-like cupin family protein
MTASIALSNSLGTAELSELVQDMAATPYLWARLVHFGNTDRRWWTRVYADDAADVWLLTWLPAHSTDLHDHGASAAAFTVVQGTLEEVRADENGRLTTRQLRAGAAASVARGVVHDVRASDTAPTVSIHAYSPPITQMTYYAHTTGGLRPTHTVDTDEPEQAVRR